MKRQRAAPFMRRDRAKLFSAVSRKSLVEWEITIVPGQPAPYTKRLEQNVRIRIDRPDEKPFVLVLDADAVHQFREDLGAAFDQVNGI